MQWLHFKIFSTARIYYRFTQNNFGTYTIWDDTIKQLAMVLQMGVLLIYSRPFNEASLSVSESDSAELEGHWP